MKKRYFCYSTDQFIIGGSETYALRLFEKMKRQGFFNVLLLWKGAKVDASWNDRLSELDVQIAYISKKNPISIPRREDIKRLRFERGSQVIILAVAVHNYLNALCLSYLYPGRKYQCIFYPLQEVAFDGLFFDEKLQNFFVKTFINRICTKHNFFIMTQYFGQYIHKKYHVDFTSRMVHLGMVLSPLDAGVINARTEERVSHILAIARMDGNAKSYLFGLIDVFASLKSKYTDLTLTIIGDGSNKAKLMKKADSYSKKVAKDIIFTGSVEYTQLGKYIEKSQIYVGMGTTVLDVAMTGLPSIVVGGFERGYDTWGFFHEIKEVGAVLDKRFKALIYDAIERVYLMQKDTYIAVSHQTYDVLKNDFNVDNVVKSMLLSDADRRPWVFVFGLAFLLWLAREL